MKKDKLFLKYFCLTAVMLVPFASQPGLSQANDQQAADVMSRAEVYAEMESTLGLAPTFMKSIPDSTLGLEWELMKRVQMMPGPIPNKYRELIGVAVSAATKCQYCAFFHTEFARLNGATDEEIEDALHYTKSTTGWSTYINGSQADFDLFKSEMKAITAYVKKKTSKESGGGSM
jgi:AhpD family alkylhydroperoxidase